MRFVFLSGPDCGDVASVVFHGLLFAAGEPVEVDDPRTIAKLAGNRFFARAAGGDDAAPPRAPARRSRSKGQG